MKKPRNLKYQGLDSTFEAKLCDGNVIRLEGWDGHFNIMPNEFKKFMKWATKTDKYLKSLKKKL